MNINISASKFIEEPQEFVERKGLGHPDTLSDALAETLSVNYSLYTKHNFGAILHHNFDKVGLLGGASYVIFGQGYLTKPIRVMLNGRASTKFGEKIIPVKELLIGWSKEFMTEKFPTINPEKDLEFHYNLSNQSSPGKTNEHGSDKGTRKYWFEPRNLGDLQETKRLVSNDTSLGVGYCPHTRLESLVLKIENKFNSKEFSKEHPWVGSDIKVMGYRNENAFHITLCIPQIAQFVGSIEKYKENLDYSRKIILGISESMGINELHLSINTRDNYENSEIYLTAIGSSIESGDEGLVGRGNRINGVISPLKPMSMEGACGKNPVYHIGKVYYVAAQKLSTEIFEKFGVANKVFMVSQSGRDLIDPWETTVIIDDSLKNINVKELRSFVENANLNIPKLTDGLLEHKYQLY